MLDDVGGHRETPANQQEKNVEAHCGSETPSQMKLGWSTHKEQPGAAKSSLQRVRTMQSHRWHRPNSGMDTMVSHKFYEK